MSNAMAYVGTYLPPASRCRRGWAPAQPTYLPPRIGGYLPWLQSLSPTNLLGSEALRRNPERREPLLTTVPVVTEPATGWLAPTPAPPVGPTARAPVPGEMGDDGGSETVVPEWDTPSAGAMETPADLQHASQPPAVVIIIARRAVPVQQAGVGALGLLVIVALVLALGGDDGATLSAPPGSSSDPPSVRTAALLSHMSLDDKSALLVGAGESVLEIALTMAGLRVPHPCGECPYGDQDDKDYDKCMSGHVCGNARLKIPTIRMNDGPQVRFLLIFTVFRLFSDCFPTVFRLFSDCFPTVFRLPSDCVATDLIPLAGRGSAPRRRRRTARPSRCSSRRSVCSPGFSAAAAARYRSLTSASSAKRSGSPRERFVFKMMNFVFKRITFVFKMPNSAVGRSDGISGAAVEPAASERELLAERSQAD